MNILAIGDICGKSGCEELLKKLPKIKKDYKIDLTVVNGENSAEGNGILPSSAESIFAAGADVITGGNHTLRRKEIYNILEENSRVLRPANYPDSVPGSGIAYVDLGYTIAAVINIMGVIYLENLACPFETADKMILQAQKNGAKQIFIDFHAEATSEKRTLGFYLDGKITAMFGTHTHVQTADAQILTNGSGYITDLGMTGVIDSVLGIKKEIIIKRMKDKLPEKFCNAQGEAQVCGCIFTTDNKTGKTIAVKRIVV